MTSRAYGRYAASVTDDGQQSQTVRRLPAWPLILLFGFYPFWWAVGVVDVIRIPVGALMAMQMFRAGTLQAPRGFGIWLLFLLWAGCSGIMLGSAGDLIGFTYRYLLYIAATSLFIYVYNGREALTSRAVSGMMTCWWLTTVIGGYLGILFPAGVIRTPMSYLLPAGLQSNELVNHMVIRRLAQYNSESSLQLEPRPSAPFLYTNNWGNVYSLLLPFVLVYLIEVRGERRYPWLLAMLPISAVPAALTLNRGMFVGIGIAIAYVVLRLLILRRFRAVGGLVALAALGLLLFQLLPTQERLANRLGGDTGTNSTRSSLYLQSLELVPESPIFGLGGPQPSSGVEQPPVGTQGQLWMLLVSHGPIATALFTGWFILVFLRTRRRTDPMSLAAGTIILVGTVELLYYGILPNGLPIMMVATAMALRPPQGSRQGAPAAQTGSAHSLTAIGS